MAGFEELGTGLFIMVFTINLFLAGFGGVALPNNFQTFITDVNITSSSVLNERYQVSSSSYSTPTQTQLTNQNDPFGSVVNLITRDAAGFLRTVLVGITDLAISMGAPSGFLLGIIIPINIIFLFYLAQFLAGFAATGIARLIGA